ncbi:MAG: molybdopterin-binding protein, partial [Desulfuromonadales bacterium]|nr:molybdopterin-binding protein [Desulfuromonadales bacterium]
MTISLLTIGDELLNGDLADTNTAAIAKRLGEESYLIQRSETVGDQLEIMVDALRRHAQQADAVIVTGGLGPTEDDRTAKAAAAAFERPLALNDVALQQIRERFRAWNRPMH